jgi:hypothetical protein
LAGTTAEGGSSAMLAGTGVGVSVGINVSVADGMTAINGVEVGAGVSDGGASVSEGMTALGEGGRVAV